MLKPGGLVIRRLEYVDNPSHSYWYIFFINSSLALVQESPLMNRGTVTRTYPLRTMNVTTWTILYKSVNRCWIILLNRLTLWHCGGTVGVTLCTMNVCIKFNLNISNSCWGLCFRIQPGGIAKEKIKLQTNQNVSYKKSECQHMQNFCGN